MAYAFLFVALTVQTGCRGCGTDAHAHAERTPNEEHEQRLLSASHPVPPFVEHRVQAGETLLRIAKRYDVSVATIVAANDLSPKRTNFIRMGQVLRIPGVQPAPPGADSSDDLSIEPVSVPAPPEPDGKGAFHVLARGETLWDVARLYETSLDTLLQSNGLREEHLRLLRDGRKVWVPGVTKARIKRTKPATRRGVYHTLRQGETVWDLARVFKVSVAELMAANALSASGVAHLRAGKRLFLPGVKRDIHGRFARINTDAQQRATMEGRRLGLGTRRAAGLLLMGRPKSPWVRAVSGANVDALPGTLRWPVTNGWFTRGFGSGKGGYHLAIDIMGEVGWNVRAAERGIVGYAGNGVRGYGNVVMLIHPGGWVTMYAHNSVNFVVAGQRVKRGDILAEVGSTGISRGPHVHFELMHNGRNCDPTSLFRPAVKHRGGRSSNVKRRAWYNANAKPKSLRCLARRRYPHGASVDADVAATPASSP